MITRVTALSIGRFKHALTQRISKKVWCASHTARAAPQSGWEGLNSSTETSQLVGYTHTQQIIQLSANRASLKEATTGRGREAGRGGVQRLPLQGKTITLAPFKCSTILERYINHWCGRGRCPPHHLKKKRLNPAPPPQSLIDSHTLTKQMTVSAASLI